MEGRHITKMSNSKCVDCGRPVSKDGAPAFCDYHHAKALRLSELAIYAELHNKTIYAECSNCHNISDYESCYYIGNITLCEPCYQKDRTLKKRQQ
jgi:hypothetical protein